MLVQPREQDFPIHPSEAVAGRDKTVGSRKLSVFRSSQYPMDTGMIAAGALFPFGNHCGRKVHGIDMLGPRGHASGNIACPASKIPNVNWNVIRHQIGQKGEKSRMMGRPMVVDFNDAGVFERLSVVPSEVFRLTYHVSC